MPLPQDFTGHYAVASSAPFVASACLAGVPCRYDGGATPFAPVYDLAREGRALLVCPELLGGLGVPRAACERTGQAVLGKDGADVTAAFARGAAEALRLARAWGCKTAILKARSPSCGVGRIYDGTFSGVLIPGDGVFAALLRAAGLALWTEETFRA